jgi:hypothetical protein
MSLFKQELPFVARTAQIDAQAPGVSGATSVAAKPVYIPLYNLVTVSGLSASSTNQVVFIANDSYQVADVRVTFGTAGGASAAVTVEHLTGTQASGAGTAVLSAPMSLTGAANTPVTGSLLAAGSTNNAALQLNAGDRLGIVFSGTLTGLANCNITIYLTRWQ